MQKAENMSGRRVTGEGRVVLVKDKVAFVSSQKLNGKALVTLSSLKTKPKERPPTALQQILEVNDIVTFEAVEKAELAGSAKYAAIDGTVKVKIRSKQNTFEGDGKILNLDPSRGCFGFVDSVDIGSVFFNVAVARPQTNDVHSVFKVGQRVKFRAVPNDGQTGSKWRATVVCPYGKAAEFMPKPVQQVPRVKTLSRCDSDVSLNSEKLSQSSFNIERNRARSICSNGSGASFENEDVFPAGTTTSPKLSQAAYTTTTTTNNDNYNNNNNNNNNGFQTKQSSPASAVAIGETLDINKENDHQHGSFTFYCQFYDCYADISRRIINLAHKLNGFSSEQDCIQCKVD